MSRKNMPPRKHPEQPSPRDREVLAKWVKAGAPPFEADAVSVHKPVALTEVLTAVRDHLTRTRANRDSLRFFTLHTLRNDPELSDDDLALVRAALSKAINSLHDRPRIIVPRAVDAAGIGSEKPVSATLERSDKPGLAFVDIPRDRVYLVKLYNNADHDAAVSLTVDGVDVFHFSKDRDDAGRPRFTHFVVRAKSELTIPGWHNTIDAEARDNFRSFLVTEYGQGAASQLGKPRGSVGVIHVQFARCFELADGAKSKGGNETGFGPPREVKQKVIRVEIEPPHDFVSVRYSR